MGRRAPSTTTSPELRRKRTAAPPPPPSPRRFCSISDVLRRAPLAGGPPPVARAPSGQAYEAALCEVCGSGERDEELLLCDLCDRGRHIFCFRPIAARVPSGPWLCPD